MEHNASEGQVLLKWALQQNISVIPRSTSAEHQEEYLRAKGLPTLSESAMTALSADHLQQRRPGTSYGLAYINDDDRAWTKASCPLDVTPTALSSRQQYWPCSAGAKDCVLFVGCASCEHNVTAVAEALVPPLAARNVTVRYVAVENESTLDLLKSDGLSAVLIYMDHRAPARVEAQLLAALRQVTKKGVWVIAMHATVAAFPRRTAIDDAWGRFLGGRYRGNARRRQCCRSIISEVTSGASSFAPFFSTTAVSGFDEEYVIEIVDPADSLVTILETVTHPVGRSVAPTAWSWVRHPVAPGEAGVLFMCWGDRHFQHKSEINAVDTPAFADRLAASIRWVATKPAIRPSHL